MECLTYIIQSSEDVLVADSPGTVELQQETVAFHDESTGYSVGVPTSHPSTALADQIDTVPLSDFLSRPVRIANFSYTETNNIADTIFQGNPWQLLFNDVRIRYKLNNYAFIRCNLKLKFIINASPFYYGAALATYQPLPNFTPSTIVNDGSSRFLIPISQRPHLWMFPQNSQGGEMTLPFFYQKNWVSINNYQEFADLGQLTVTAYTPLRSANGAVGQGVTVTVYAWAEDVQLSASTLSLALQSQEYEIQSDEYGEGVISKPASAIANAMGMLSQIPVIGRFATATQIGANAVSAVASLFGYTNVPVLEPTKPLRPSMFPPLASTDVGYPVEKLTVDSKNELSVDPSILGISNKDELCISNFVSRESYYYQTTWDTTQTVDTILAYTKVTPFAFQTTGNVVNSNVYFTPMAYVANLFEHWRGDIIYNFKIIKSPFHRGRLKISYDPLGDASNNLVNTPESSTVVMTQIIDLGADDNIELRIPFQQALPWLVVNNSFAVNNISYDNSTTPTFNVNNANDNGAFTIRVMNILSAPVASAPVTILVSVRGAENLEYANPISPGTTVQPFIIQSEEMPIDIKTQMGVAKDKEEKHRALVNFGEVVKSLRPLLRRTNFSQSLTFASSSASGISALEYQFHKIPPYPGYDPGSDIAAKGLVLTTSYFPYNYVYWHPLQWMSLAFVSYRGSIMWHFNTNSTLTGGLSPDVRVARVPNAPGPNARTTTNTLLGAGAVNVNTRAMNLLARNTAAGVAVTNQNTQSGISISTPNYTNYLMQSTDPRSATNPSTLSQRNDGSSLDTFVYSNILPSTSTTVSTTYAPKVDVYCGAGTDFNLFFFLNCPVLYKTTTAFPVT